MLYTYNIHNSGKNCFKIFKKIAVLNELIWKGCQDIYRAAGMLICVRSKACISPNARQGIAHLCGDTERPWGGFPSRGALGGWGQRGRETCFSLCALLYFWNLVPWLWATLVKTFLINKSNRTWKTKREVRKLSLSAAITVALKPPSLWEREKPAQGLYMAWWVRVGMKEYINAICHLNQLQGPQNVCKVLESIQWKTNLIHSM